MASGKICNTYAGYTESVTTGSGTSITVFFRKVGRVCQMRLSNGTYTANANETLITIPDGFIPAENLDFRDTYSNKRLMGSGKYLYCPESLSSTILRGIVTYIVEAS